MKFASRLDVRHTLRPVVVLTFVTFVAAACSDRTPIAPTPEPLTVAGTWTGDLSLEGIAVRMTWTLTQTNDVVRGPVLVHLPSGVVLMNGTLAGTLTGSVLTYTIAVSPGGIPSQPACTGQLAGTVAATISVVSTLTGTSSVTSSVCTTPFSSSTFTLIKS
jgi:hypothetical protein